MVKRKIIPELRFSGFDSEWSVYRLQDIAIKITDGTHDTPKPVKEGIPFLTAIHIKDGFIDYDNCYYVSEAVHKIIYQRCNPEKGDLLIVNIGAGTATCALNSVDYEFSLKNVALVKLDKKIALPTFIEQIQRQNSRKIFNQLTSGGAQPFLSLNEICKIKLTIPSLPEQQKIASFLTSVDERIQQLTRKKKLLEQYKKGVMQKIFSQEIRFKPALSGAEGDDNGKDFPDWELRKLKDITIPIKRITKSVNDNILTISGGRGFLHQKERFSKVIAGSSLSKYTLLKKGEFSYNRGSSKSYIYGCVYKLNDYDEALVPNVYKSFKFTEGVPEYFEQLFIKSFLDKQLKQIISSTARLDGLLNISDEDFYNCKVIFPDPREQQKIANILIAIDKKIELVNTQLQKTQAWKKGLLQKMFV